MPDRYYGPSWGSIGFLTGLVVGGLAALIMATDDKGNTKPDVKRRLTTSKARARAEMAKVQEMLNQSWDNLNDAYLQAKRNLSLKLEQLKKNAGSIDKDRYLEAVNEVVAEMKKSGAATAEQLGNIKAFLVEDYTKLATTPAPKKQAGRKKAR